MRIGAGRRCWKLGMQLIAGMMFVWTMCSLMFGWVMESYNQRECLATAPTATDTFAIQPRYTILLKLLVPATSNEPVAHVAKLSTQWLSTSRNQGTSFRQCIAFSLVYFTQLLQAAFLERTF
jgi:hypothetical protein